MRRREKEMRRREKEMRKREEEGRAGQGCRPVLDF